jgi:hypothetical protein
MRRPQLVTPYIFTVSYCFVLYNKDILTRYIKRLILNNQAIKKTQEKKAPHDKYPPVINVYRIYQMWDYGFTRFSISDKEN